MKKYKTKFDKITEYGTGAKRGDSSGKGRFDLIPANALMRIAQVYERGGDKHGDRNWEDGFPMSRGLDSAIRHIYQRISGMEDEDHLGQAVWNLLAVMHFEEMIEQGVLEHDLNDLPQYISEVDAALEKEVKVNVLQKSSVVKVLHLPTGHQVTEYRYDSKEKNYRSAMRELKNILQATNEVIEIKLDRLKPAE